MSRDTPTTTADLEAAFPALVAEARADAARAERERLLGLDSLTVLGHDALIRAAKRDGRTAEQVALVIVRGRSPAAAISQSGNA